MTDKDRPLIPVYHPDEIPPGMTPEQTADFWDTHEVTDQLWDLLPTGDAMVIFDALWYAEQKRHNRSRRDPDVEQPK